MPARPRFAAFVILFALSLAGLRMTPACEQDSDRNGRATAPGDVALLAQESGADHLAAPATVQAPAIFAEPTPPFQPALHLVGLCKERRLAAKPGATLGPVLNRGPPRRTVHD